MIKLSLTSDFFKKNHIKEKIDLYCFENFHTFMFKIKKQSKIASQKSSDFASKTFLT